MTRIDFHFNAPDKVGHACRLLRKAVVGRCARLLVTAEPSLLDALDVALWEFSTVDFMGHCRCTDELQIVKRSSVVLAPLAAVQSASAEQILVNLGTEVPPGFERFERLIEIVGCDESDRRCGRVRWRHYADRGYSLARHDMAGKNYDD